MPGPGAAAAPGSPGPRAGSPAASGSPAGGFGAGQPLDVAPGGSALLGFAERVAGDEERLGGATDDEIIGLICALDRAEASACSLKHAAVAELIRRRPAPGCPLEGEARMPECWEEFAADEVRWALAETRYEADAMLDLAHALEVKLPGTREAFRTGVLRRSKAEIIARATQVLDPDEARAAEAMVLGRAGRLSPGGLRAAIARAVIEVAPDKARKRREEAVRDARVERWPEDSGNAALAGRELPPAEVLAADQRITWWARQLKAAGLEGSMDELRARAYLDLLLDTDSRPATPCRRTPKPGRRAPAIRANPASPRQPRPDPGRHRGSGVIPAGFTGRNHLTVPLATLLELADRPGEIPGLGPVDPWLGPRPGPRLRRQPQDHLVPYRHRRPGPRHRPRMRQTRAQEAPQTPGRSARNRPAGRPRPTRARVHLHPRRCGRAARRIRKLAVHHRHPRPARPADRDRPDRHRRPAITGSPPPVTTPGSSSGTCPRSGTPCAPDPCAGVPQPGRTSSTTPRTTKAAEAACATADPKCRHEHRLKQDPRWTVEQPTPSTFRWTTPSGRQYTTEPTRYPI